MDALEGIARDSHQRLNSQQNAHKKLSWYTERRGRVIIDFWVSFSNVVVVVGRLVRGVASLPLGGPPRTAPMTYRRSL